MAFKMRVHVQIISLGRKLQAAVKISAKMGRFTYKMFNNKMFSKQLTSLLCNFIDRKPVLT